MQIGKYFASIGFDVSKKDIKKVDNAFDHIENRFRKLGAFSNKGIKFQISGFVVDQRKLNLALGNALDMASRQVTFEVSRFVVNQSALNRTIGGALERASVVSAARTGGSSRGAMAVPAGRGGVGIGLGGVFGGALALGLGGYGLSQLNQRNQQVVSAQLQTNAVVQQAGGTHAQGGAVFDWLKSEANRVGFSYLDAAPDFNKLLSGLTGAGMSVAQGQNVFKGFSELSRVNKLDRTAQSRVFRALSQVAGKNKLQSEELTGQLAESLPGAVSIFAQAYQNKLTAEGKGGGKSGQEAISELYAAMKKGLVKGDILPYAGKEASARAEGGLAAASRASQAEQARMQNEINNQAIIASNAGVEEGFARLFRTISTGLSESTGLTRGLAEGFNEATKLAEKLILFPQSFARALEGRDSLVADWLGEGQTKELREDWSEIRVSLESIFGMKSPEWFNPLKEIAQELKNLIGAAGGISQKYRETKQVAQQIQVDSIAEYGPTLGGIVGLGKANYFTLASTLGLVEQAGGYGLNKVMDTLPFARHTPVSGLMENLANSMSTPNDTVAKYYINRDRNLGFDTDTMYGSSVEGWRDFNRESNRSLAMDVFGNNGYGPSSDSASGVKSSSDAYLQGVTQANSTVSNTFNMEFHMTGDIDTMENWFRSSLSKEIEKVMPNLPEK